MPEGQEWIMQRIALEGSALEVFTPVGESEWLEIAQRFWLGELWDLSPIRSSRFTLVSRGVFLGRLCYLKLFRVREGRFDTVKHIIRASRARRACINSIRLGECGFGVPRPLCFVEEWRRHVVRKSMLITEAIEDAPSVWEWIRETREGGCAALGRRRAMLQAFGREVGRMHASGVVHGDMTLNNVLCEERNGAFRFYWLDNERTRRPVVFAGRQRLRNLIQLNKINRVITRTDRLRFFQAYLAGGGAPRSTRRMIRKVLRGTARRNLPRYE